MRETIKRTAERLLLVALGIVLRQLWPIADGTSVRRRRARPLVASGTASTSSFAIPFSPGNAAQQSTPSRPNIVICLLDDAGAGDAGALGHPLLHTPHIDAFAANAVAFSQAYAGAPNCSPSRASLLTGRAPYRTGVYDFLSKQSGSMHLDRRERTMAAALRDAGYATAHYGKWHLARGKHGHLPRRFGFQHSNGSYLAASALLRDFVGWVGNGRTSRDQPFFGYLALWEPHEPVQRWSPPRTQRLYSRSPLERAAAAEAASDAPNVRVGRRGGRRRAQQPPKLPPPASLEDLAPNLASGGGGCVWRLPQRNPPRVYYGAMSQVDESFGRMLGELTRLGVRDNTLTILTSDNGPEHRELNSWGSSGGLRGAKGYVYEGGIRIPMLVQWPAAIRDAPFVVHEPVHQWDLLPTLCAAAGVTACSARDRPLDGVSLLGLLLGGEHAAEGEQTAEEPTTMPMPSREPSRDASRDAATLAAAAEKRGEYVRLRPYAATVPGMPALATGPAQALPLPRVAGGAFADAAEATAARGSALVRPTPLFWSMHRGRGGMQYALRVGPWKLLGGYGAYSDRGVGPDGGGEVVPWLRSTASIGRVELYLLTHDPAERIDLSAAYPHVVALLLPEMLRLLRETAREGPDVAGWRQRSPPCPRFIKDLNVTEWCCQPLPATARGTRPPDAEEEARPMATIAWRTLTMEDVEVGESA
jgi:arylsulfatase A-like enzyme